MDGRDVADVEIEDLERAQLRQPGQERDVLTDPTLALIELELDHVVLLHGVEHCVGPARREDGAPAILAIFNEHGAYLYPKKSLAHCGNKWARSGPIGFTLFSRTCLPPFSMIFSCSATSRAVLPPRTSVVLTVPTSPGKS